MGLENKKYLYVQESLGDIKLGLKAPVRKFDIEFNPQKIELIEEPEVPPESNLGYFKYIPKDVKLREMNGSFVLCYTDNIEKVRAEWFRAIISSWKHYKELESYKLVKFGASWHFGMMEKIREAEEHKEKYPELWM